MDFKNIPVERQPAYTWLWNTTATREEIKKQIDEMYESGIRAFYILGEPERFRPTRRRTHLSPEYLSDAYIELVYYAFELAKEKGMYTWLYNEGGFPSGMACGKVIDLRPDLIQRQVLEREYTLPAGTPYERNADVLVSFCDGIRLKEGDTFSQDRQISDLCDAPMPTDIQSDIARTETTELFLKLTHEALKSRFGDAMGRDVTMMFDDEAFMGTWSEGLDKLFFEKYGYDLLDYLPYVIGSPAFVPETDAQRRAKIDYSMLCGDLVRENYFAVMRKWLNENGMLSVGHLDLDHAAIQSNFKKYGNSLKMLREFDVPGVDVIWSQISYPDASGKSCRDPIFEANEFFPRLASSAANQQGHSVCLSESFAVYGAHVTPEEMRYIVNYQAVRGISLYNFMVISLDRKGVMCYQYRPNFIGESVGMDTLSEINDYTARISHILQSSRPEIRTALYYPQRTICADGEFERETIESYMALGDMLERKGVSFDIIDEDLVLGGRIENGALVCENVVYENVFVPVGAYELPEVLSKLALVNKEIAPCIERKNPKIIARKVIFEGGDEGYFIVNTAAEAVSDTVTIHSARTPYRIDLHSGETYDLPHKRQGDAISFAADLLRGEGMMVFLSDTAQQAKEDAQIGEAYALAFDRAYINREYSIKQGPHNEYFAEGERPIGLGEWEKHFSGEATYVFHADGIEDGDYMLDLGEVRHSEKICVNGKKACEKTMPPYRMRLNDLKSGDEIRICVANTIANVCHDAEFFSTEHPHDVGPYHARMITFECNAPAGGLLGEVKISRIKK